MDAYKLIGQYMGVEYPAASENGSGVKPTAQAPTAKEPGAQTTNFQGRIALQRRGRLDGSGLLEG